MLRFNPISRQPQQKQSFGAFSIEATDSLNQIKRKNFNLAMEGLSNNPKFKFKEFPLNKPQSIRQTSVSSRYIVEGNNSSSRAVDENKVIKQLRKDFGWGINIEKYRGAQEQRELELSTQKTKDLYLNI